MHVQALIMRFIAVALNERSHKLFVKSKTAARTISYLIFHFYDMPEIVFDRTNMASTFVCAVASERLRIFYQQFLMCVLILGRFLIV
jgi:hypothetical protein